MLSNEKWFGASAGFYPETIDQSARFNDDDNAYLNDTSPQSGNRRTFTISLWFKRSNLGTYQSLYSAGTVGNYFTMVYFYNDVLYIQDYASSVQYNLVTTQVFRDTTNWYHMVIAYDTTQATASNRIKLYINGSQVTSFSTETYPSQNYDTFANSNITNNNISIGAYSNNLSATNFRFDGYLAEYNLIDGTALTPSSFGETKNGVWIPKAISGLTYGTNGFRLTFADSSNLGDDTSGNGNDFATNGLASTDVVLDSPSNNFAVLNKADARYGSFSEGNLRDTYATTGELRRSTHASKTGKWYAEVNCVGSGGYNLGIYPTEGYDKDNDPNYGVHYRGSTGQKVVSNVVSSYGATYGVNDIIGIAVDMDNNTVTFYKNNVSQGSISYTIDTHHAFHNYSASGSSAFFNFGQDSTFGGNETRQNNADDNGNGDFYYTPPSGYLALCSSNLPDTTISPNQSTQADDHFNTVLWTGNASNTHQITGVGFQPDWVWIKERTNASSNYLIDSSRGLGTGDSFRALISDSTDAEYTALNDQLRTLDSDGFTLDDNTDTNFYVNRNSQTYVAWNWKANGGTTSSNGDGDITSTVQVNSDAGFSIVLFTGDGNNGSTVGHGLGVKPAWMIIKDRDTNSAGHWMVWHQSFSDTDNNLFLNLTNGLNNAGFPSGTDPTTTTTFVPAVTSYNNVNGNDYVAYIFSEVEGYSKFGSYTGNSNADGTFVYTGFRPAWLMVKRTTTENWVIHDNARDPHNVVHKILLAESSNAEVSDNSVDFISNGFKWRVNSGARNTSGQTYIYMAFAEQPFKFSNAR